MEDHFVVGVDIGGTHITAALIDLHKKEIVANTCMRQSVDSTGNYEEIVKAWSDVIAQSLSVMAFDKLPIGIAMPGPFDYDAGICLIKHQDKFRSLYGKNLKTVFSDHFSLNPDQVLFINDAAGFLQGEVFVGAAKSAKNVLGITLGTGLGSAFYKEESTEDAALWNAPFLNGIAEDYLSTSWFLKRYEELGGQALQGVKELSTRVATDPRAELVFAEFGENFGLFLEPILKIRAIEQVILGGNIAKAYSCFEHSLRKTLLQSAVHSSIQVSKLQEQATLFGAASLFKNH